MACCAGSPLLSFVCVCVSISACAWFPVVCTARLCAGGCASRRELTAGDGVFACPLWGWSCCAGLGVGRWWGCLWGGRARAGGVGGVLQATKGRCCCAVGLHGPGYWAKHCGTSGGGLRSEGAFWCPSCFTRERVREHAGGVHQSRSGPPLWDNRQQRHCDASGRKGGWGVRKAGAPTEAPRRGHVSASTCRDDIQLTTAHAL